MSKINAPFVVSHDKLRKIKTPGDTPTWKPVAHHDIFESFAKLLQRRKFKLIDAKHTLSHEGRRYFGVINIARASDDFHLSVGIRNSHDKFLAAGAVAGSRVVVCSNLVFSGEHKFTERHIGDVRGKLDAHVGGIIDQLVTDYDVQDLRFASYQEREVTEAEANDFFIRSIDAGVVAASDLPHVIKQWRTPDHPEFAADGKTAWRLFNAYTDFFKGVNLFDLPRRGEALHTLTDNLCAP